MNYPHGTVPLEEWEECIDVEKDDNDRETLFIDVENIDRENDDREPKEEEIEEGEGELIIDEENDDRETKEEEIEEGEGKLIIDEENDDGETKLIIDENVNDDEETTVGLLYD